MHNDIYEAVLFDMDGVVVDTEEAVTRFWLDLADRYALTLTAQDFRERIYGRKAVYTLETLFPPMDKAQLDEFFVNLEAYENDATYKPIPGVIDLLCGLKRAGVRTGLVTSAQIPKITVVSNQLGLDGLFDVIVNGDDIVEGKPHPDCYLLGARKLAKAPGRCIVFEDARSGVQAAVAAGTTCIGINRVQDFLIDVGAAFVVPDFTAITFHTDHDLVWLDFAPDHRLALKTG